MSLRTFREIVNKTPVLSELAKFSYKLIDTKSHSLLKDCKHSKASIIRQILQTLPTPLSPIVEKDISKIEFQRVLFANNHKLLSADQNTHLGFDRNISIARAAKDSKRAYQCRFFYLLAHAIHAKNVIELGTNLGISSAYMALALQQNPDAKLTTFDASLDRLNLAKKFHRKMGINHIHYVEGFFDQTLSSAISGMDDIDLTFIDGNHQYKPTLKYFDNICAHCTPDAAFIIDDIRWDDGMRDAWRDLVKKPHVTLSVDLYSVGILFLGNPKKETKIHIPTLHDFWAR